MTVAKLWAMVLLIRVTLLLPACPMPPPNWPAVLPLTTEFITLSVDVPVASPMASSHTPAPWLRQVLSAMVELFLMRIWPVPSDSMPPPASPAWLLMTVVLSTVSAQLVLTVGFSIDTPPPSAVAELLVRMSPLRIRLTGP